MDFFQKKALVIGGSSRVGFELAVKLTEEGAEVTVTGRSISQENFTRLGAKASFIQTDFEKDFDKSFNSIQEILADIDILVVAYGPFVQKKLDQTSTSDWKKLALCDYALPGMAASLALKGMMKKGWGRIVFFGGTKTESIRSCKSNAAYAGTKTGLAVIVKSISSEYRNMGITCNAILPGFMNDAPDKNSLVDKKVIAENALLVMKHREINGLLMNVDCGWTP